jgi:hypothetical protein
MKQVGATLVAVEASKEAGGADLPGGLQGQYGNDEILPK